MPHYDDDTLALLSLGERDAVADGGRHLDTCDECRREVAELAAVVSLGRQLTPSDRAMAPAPEVWDRIVADLGAGTAARDTAALALQPVGDGSAPVVALTAAPSRRRRRILPLAAAAVVGVLIGSGATYAVTRTPAPEPGTAPAQVAVAELDPLDDPGAKGSAVLEVSAADHRTMTVRVTGLPPEPGTFYEVWLMDPSNSHLVALGVLGPDGSGRYPVPSDLDLTRYSAVDVSLQPINGSPLHSSNSAVRGTMST